MQFLHYISQGLSQKFLALFNTSSQSENEALASILKDFLDDHEMRSTEDPCLCPINEDLEAFMRSEIKARGLNAQHMERILHLAASLIELGYHNCTFEEKKLIAQFNWYLIYIDDVAPKNVETYITFEERFLRNLPQLDPALQGLADVLRSMHDYYPVFFANSIINATFEFVAGTCLEPAFEKVDVSTTSTRFPWFLRDRTGVAVAFALMLFPNSQKVEYAACFSAMADMDYWISITNDLLSYYKESLAGETANYISNRASVEGVASLQVVADLQYELLESRNHIYKLLRNNAGEKAVKIWRVWEHGYVTWHLQQKRYRLSDLGL